MPFNGFDQMMQGLDEAGLSPDSYGPLAADLERPKLQSLKPSILDFLAPVLSEIAGASDPYRQRRNKWLAPAVRGLAGAYTGYRKGQASDIEDANTIERQRVLQSNQSRLAETRGNREEYGKALRAQSPDGVLLTRRQLLEKQVREKADEAKATAKARVEGENEGRTAAGGLPIGTPTPKTTKPPTPAKFNPNSWKLWSDVDKVELDAIDQELKDLRADPSNTAAFQPPRKDTKGGLIPENTSVSAAREKVQQLNSRKFKATKRALLFHLDNLPKGGELYVYKQLDNLAQSTGLDKDPEVDAALEATADKLLPPGKK